MRGRFRAARLLLATPAASRQAQARGVTAQAVRRPIGREASLKRGSRGTAVLSTRDAVLRPAQNFLASADFKQSTVAAFTRAVDGGPKAVDAADPEASSVAKAAKSPAGDGYRYSRLTGSVEAIELYDLADNIEIVRSFNPGLICS